MLSYSALRVILLRSDWASPGVREDLDFFPRAVGEGFPFSRTFGRAMSAAGDEQVHGEF